MKYYIVEKYVFFELTNPTYRAHVKNPKTVAAVACQRFAMQQEATR